MRPEDRSVDPSLPALAWGIAGGLLASMSLCCWLSPAVAGFAAVRWEQRAGLKGDALSTGLRVGAVAALLVATAGSAIFVLAWDLGAAREILDSADVDVSRWGLLAAHAFVGAGAAGIAAVLGAAFAGTGGEAPKPASNDKAKAWEPVADAGLLPDRVPTERPDLPPPGGPTLRAAAPRLDVPVAEEPTDPMPRPRSETVDELAPFASDVPPASAVPRASDVPPPSPVAEPSAVPSATPVTESTDVPPVSAVPAASPVPPPTAVPPAAPVPPAEPDLDVHRDDLASAADEASQWGSPDEE